MSEMQMSEEDKKDGQKANNSLAEFLRFNEDVEVGFLELFREHAEDIRGGREISQMVNDQVEQQLKRDYGEKGRQTESPSLSSMKTMRCDYASLCLCHRAICTV